MSDLPSHLAAEELDCIETREGADRSLAAVDRALLEDAR